MRRDFDRIFKEDADPKDIELTIEKYELYIERTFQPYAQMHECRSHSNLWGKHVLWGDKCLETDHIGYYSPVKLHGTPSDVTYHEEYPHMVGAWVYDSQFLDASFDYNDLETQYLGSSSFKGGSAAEVKAELDAAHRK